MKKTSLYKYYFILLYKLIAPFKFYIIGMLFITILLSVFNFFGIGLLMPIMDLLLGQKTDNIVVEYIHKIFLRLSITITFRNILIVYFSLMIINSLFGFLEKVLLALFNNKLSLKMSSDIFENLMEVSYSYFHNTKKGDILYALGTPKQVIQLVQLINGLIGSLFIIISYLIMLLMLSYQLTLLTIVLLLIVIPLMRKIFQYKYKLSKRKTKAARNFNSFFVEIIDGIQIIKTYGRETYAINSFNRKFNDLLKYTFRASVNNGLISLIQQPLNVITLIIVVVVSNIYFGMTFQSIAVFLYILYKFVPSSQGIINSYNSFLQYLPNVKIAVESLSRQNKTFRKSGTHKITELTKSIKVENIHFLYIKDVPILKNITTEIEKNKMFAIVGATGCGKSTFVSLLLRFYDAKQGKILVDGVNITDLNITDWLNIISFVPQDVFLFNISIKENIMFGKLNASEEEVIEAAKIANAHEFILNLPNGYDTVIGERGVKLSGGQKQMLALARAVIKKPQILILDEATSSLDNHSERLIQNAITKISKNITIIAIAHRLSTVIHADKLIVLEKGEIVETGKHKDLLKLNGYYSKYYNLHLRSMDS